MKPLKKKKKKKKKLSILLQGQRTLTSHSTAGL